jgi:hypothetical protein
VISPGKAGMELTSTPASSFFTLKSEPGNSMSPGFKRVKQYSAGCGWFEEPLQAAIQSQTGFQYGARKIYFHFPARY